MKVNRRTIYLDHAATTLVDPLVVKAMAPYWSEKYGNPSSLYQKGVEAKEAVSAARNRIAGIIHSRPEEIIFTAGGTESVNLAIFGVARAATKLPMFKKTLPHLITTKIEHHSVLNSFQALQQEGYKATYVSVDKNGLLDLNELGKAIRPETILISVMYANNEIGTVEPIAKIGKLLKQINTNREKSGLPQIAFHTDACQAGGACNLDVNYLGVNLMTINGSKIYGPKQAGFLYVRNGINLQPIIYGGGQERGIRSGTENVAGIVGLSVALKLVSNIRLKENNRLRGLRDYAIEGILKNIERVQLNGPEEKETKAYSDDESFLRLPNNINLSFIGIEGEALMLYLDAAGISVSTGSACDTPNFEPSHVLVAIGKTLKEARGSVRITLGRKTTKKDLDYLIKILPPIVKKLRSVENI